MGLEPNVEKYRFTFSGIQFLLGPDREHLLSNLELFVRWCAVQIGFIIVVALGIRVGMLNPYQTRVLQLLMFRNTGLINKSCDR
jgi:hypothetical protein